MSEECPRVSGHRGIDLRDIAGSRIMHAFMHDNGEPQT